MKYLLTTAIILAACFAHAEKWVMIYGKDNIVEYMDVDSIQRNGDNATASFKRDYNDHAVRKAQDAAEKFFTFVQSRSVMTFECNGDRHSFDQLWEVAADGKTRSPTKSYAMSSNSGPWEMAAKSVVCKQ